ncbi:hypothetical protein TIFTF001_049263 [Ficus carica]|uniref:Uncharacterized protein n=1 Tax=Ficus carica TaxID=3494 RepID=A0AA87ZKP4_FICCA|nr:hypothetical protein TIFTF001_049255 [Ficus carica]GMN26080.1 hypothetical protein TIFTF001_049263 [Ficus carica]
MKKIGEEDQVAVDAIWDCGSPLYNSYELASLTHLIERYSTASPFSCHASQFSIPTSVGGSNQGRTINRENDHDHERGVITKLGGLGKLLKSMRITTKRTSKKSKRMSGLFFVFSAFCAGLSKK